MIDKLRDRLTNETARERMRRRPFDVDDLGTYVGDVAREARRTFGASTTETVEFVRHTIADMQHRGGVPTRLILERELRFLELETKYGTNPDHVREAVIAAWLAAGGTEDQGWFHFATPAAIEQHNKDVLYMEERRRQGLWPPKPR
jgi:hypothetical protein